MQDLVYMYNLTTCTVLIQNVANTAPANSSFTIATLPALLYKDLWKMKTINEWINKLEID